jgi:hypothetical protein
VCPQLGIVLKVNRYLKVPTVLLKLTIISSQVFCTSNIRHHVTNRKVAGSVPDEVHY